MSESKTVKGIFQLHDSGAGKGKESPFISYSVKNTTVLNTPLQIANFIITARLAVLVASGTLGSKTGLSVAWQPP